MLRTTDSDTSTANAYTYTNTSDSDAHAGWPDANADSDTHTVDVLFTDTGTVQDDFGLDEYRMSVGAGLRLAVPFLGQAPFAFDFAVPVVKEPDDETQVFSFDIALPF